MKIKLKREIVTFRQEGVDPVNAPAPFMPPAELKRRLDAGEAIVLLDTRNDVEVAKGTLTTLCSGATQLHRVRPMARDHISELQGKTVVSFCTGGIRCEKAAPICATWGE